MDDVLPGDYFTLLHDPVCLRHAATKQPVQLFTFSLNHSHVGPLLSTRQNRMGGSASVLVSSGSARSCCRHTSSLDTACASPIAVIAKDIGVFKSWRFRAYYSLLTKENTSADPVEVITPSATAPKRTCFGWL